MSDEDFLKRWARRKSAARETAPTAPPAPASPAAAASPEPEFDLSTLPSLDSISAVTDVTRFLQKGVPLELSRAALRRAWVADPTIRDFVGLAENAWDFNDPTAMPGFGPLDQTPEQVRELVARIMGESPPDPDSAVQAVDESPPALAEESVPPDTQAEASPLPQPAAPDSAAPSRERDNAPEAVSSHDDAVQNECAAPQLVQRTHGGALPR